jgi:hypothetical protein
MKKKITLFFSFVSILLISSSCIFMGPGMEGNGNVTEENRKTGDFNEIEVSRGMNVYISQGDYTKVLVRADENLMDAIETRIEGDKLIVTATKNIRKATSKKVFVTAPDFSEIKSSSGSNVFSETKIVSDNIELSSSSGSNMTVEVNSGNLEASASAGSNMKLEVVAENIESSASAGSNIKFEGATESFSGKVSSGSNIKAEDLKTKNCIAKASSGGNIWITVVEELTADASSGGNIFYYGDPEMKNIEKSSGGNVIKK